MLWNIQMLQKYLFFASIELTYGSFQIAVNDKLSRLIKNVLMISTKINIYKCDLGYIAPPSQNNNEQLINYVEMYTETISSFLFVLW